jgi:lipoprotein-anchoring transpeptidase ErfK/SrfK
MAIRHGQLAEARGLLRQVVRDDPQNQTGWLLLAKITPSSAAAAAYQKRAEALQTAHRPVKRSRQDKKHNQKPQKAYFSRWVTAIVICGIALLLALLAVALGPAAWERVSALRDEEGSDPAKVAAELPTAVLLAPFEETATPVLLPTPTMRPTPIIEATATEAADDGLEAQDGSADSREETPEPQPTMVAEDIAVDPSGLRPPGVQADERWIDVNLSTQTLVAYEGNTAVYNALISSGTWEFPTVTGQYRTYMKYESQDMDGYLLGYDYYIQNVPYVMYFFEDYAIHGAYWHNNFGVPMSHGCVNVSPEDAGWLYNWAPTGTTVTIHH